MAYLELFIMHAPKLTSLQLLVPRGSPNDPDLMAPLIPLFINCHSLSYLRIRFEVLPYLKYFDCTLNSLDIFLCPPAVLELAGVIGDQNMCCIRKLNHRQVGTFPVGNESTEELNASKEQLYQVCVKLGIKLQ